MNTSITITRRLGAALAVAAGILAGASLAAAEGATQTDPPAPEQVKSEAKSEAKPIRLVKTLKPRGTYVALTGSRIKQKVGRTRARASTMMPVIVYDNSSIDRSGASTVAQFLSRASFTR